MKGRRSGLPDFSSCKIPKRDKLSRTIKYKKDRKMDQMSIKYTYHNLPLQGPPKFTQIRIFGLKTNHLATLDEMGHVRAKYLKTKIN
jgi:hypothetical protein